MLIPFSVTLGGVSVIARKDSSSPARPDVREALRRKAGLLPLTMSQPVDRMVFPRSVLASGGRERIPADRTPSFKRYLLTFKKYFKRPFIQLICFVMPIIIHLVFALLAVPLGLINLIGEKGTFRHKVIGWFWVIGVGIASVGSFGIRELNPGSLSWIHGLSVFTLFCLISGIIAIKRGDVRRHRNFMIGTFLGLLLAGGFALMPGRYIAGVIGY